MNRKAVGVVFLLLAGACQQDAPKADNVAANQAAAAVTMKPGKYQIDFVREIMAPGYPSEPEREVVSQCFSEGELANLQEVLVPTTRACHDKEIKIADGEVSAKMRCSAPEAGVDDAGFEIRGRYDEEGAEMTGDATLPDGTLRETRTFKRLGDC